MSSIQVTPKSKKHWENYKNHPSESMEKMINRILKLAFEDEEPLTKIDLKDIEASLKDFKIGKFTTNKELRAELNL